MNENIDLTNILKDCPEGFQLYSSIFGTVYFKKVTPYTIHVDTIREIEAIFRQNGKYFSEYEEGECTLFPSKEQRDWSKFTAPWYKKEKFNTKTLQPFDKVLCKNGLDVWHCDFFSCYMETWICPNACISGSYMYCIPYNDETKHLVGTKNEVPEYYKYWED